MMYKNNIPVEGSSRFSSALAMGFSIFEFSVILFAVSILFIIFFKKNASVMESIPHSVSTYQSKVFLRTIHKLHAVARMERSRVVHLDEETTIYFNVHGWPISSSAIRDVDKDKASVLGCESLWIGLMTENNKDKGSFFTYQFELKDFNICRVFSKKDKEDPIFFDYDVISGEFFIPPM